MGEAAGVGWESIVGYHGRLVCNGRFHGCESLLEALLASVVLSVVLLNSCCE